jgi:hypothetical protein
MHVRRVVRVLLPLALTAFAILSPPLRSVASPAFPSGIALDAPAPVAATIHLESGRSLDAVYVGPWAMGAVRCVLPDGSREYLSKHQIVRIVDTEGRDVTREILVDRKRIGPSDALGAKSVPPLFASAFTCEPKRLARGYAVTEVTMTARRKDVSDGATIYAAGVGGIANLSRSWGVGGLVHFASGTQSYKGGDLGLRIRRYLRDDASLDFGAGVWAADLDSWRTTGMPLFADASVTFADAVSLVVRVESADWSSDAVLLPAWGVGGYVGLPAESRRRETTWSTGIRIGPSPRWISIPAFAVGVVAFLSPGPRAVY